VWRIGAGGVQKELALAPRVAWSDASVAWKNAATVAVEYTADGETGPRTLERGLDDAAWRRVR
jgi:hypothetical protein